MEFDTPIEYVLNRATVGLVAAIVWHYMWRATKPREATDILEAL